MTNKGKPLNDMEEKLVSIVDDNPGIGVWELQRRTETQQNRAIHNIREKWRCTCKTNGGGKNPLCFASKHIYCTAEQVGHSKHNHWFTEYEPKISKTISIWEQQALV